MYLLHANVNLWLTTVEHQPYNSSWVILLVKTIPIDSEDEGCGAYFQRQRIIFKFHSVHTYVRLQYGTVRAWIHIDYCYRLVYRPDNPVNCPKPTKHLCHNRHICANPKPQINCPTSGEHDSRPRDFPRQYHVTRDEIKTGYLESSHTSVSYILQEISRSWTKTTAW